jgi:hypothetical protein
MLGLVWLVIIPQTVNAFDVLLNEAHVDAAHRTVEIEGVSQKSWNGIIGILCAE